MRAMTIVSLLVKAVDSWLMLVDNSALVAVRRHSSIYALPQPAPEDATQDTLSFGRRKTPLIDEARTNALLFCPCSSSRSDKAITSESHFTRDITHISIFILLAFERARYRFTNSLIECARGPTGSSMPRVRRTCQNRPGDVRSLALAVFLATRKRFFTNLNHNFN